MKKILLVFALAAISTACARTDGYGGEDTPTKKELTARNGALPSSSEATPSATPATATTPTPASTAAERDGRTPADDPAGERKYREVTLPAGTVLPLTLRSSVGSDTSRVEDPVRATLRSAVRAGGVQALPAGTVVTGHVTNAQRSGRVKGRAQIAFRFTRVDVPGEGGVTNIRTATVARYAPATKKRDAATIGGGAVGGAIVGGIVGGGDGAAKGAAIGGAGGTGVVLATRGKEVRMAAGSPVLVKLTQPLTVRVPVR